MTDKKSSAPQPPTMHTKHVAASVSDMVQEWYSGKSDVPHMTADLFERRISRFQALEPAHPDPLGAAWMREQAAEVVWSAHDEKDAAYWGFSPSDIARREKSTAIRAIPDPTHADQLAQAMKLPEVAALVEAGQTTRRQFSPFPSEDTERWREEHEACENMDAALAALVQP